MKSNIEKHTYKKPKIGKLDTMTQFLAMYSGSIEFDGGDPIYIPGSGTLLPTKKKS